MAANALPCNKQHVIIQKISQGAQRIRDGARDIDDALAAVVALKDGDGSQASHFDALADECAFQAGDYGSEEAAAKALYDELNSVEGNSNTAAAAAAQLCGYLGLP